jgi:nucleoside-diphosphate-sugar epimerase
LNTPNEIIGRGLVGAAANQLKCRGASVFASGVSNSGQVIQSEYDRELGLLARHLALGKGVFVYFSTTSIQMGGVHKRCYADHKRACERVIETSGRPYLIARTGNLVGRTHNRNTLFNYIYWKIKEGEPFDLWLNAKRNFLDVTHLMAMVDAVLGEWTQSVKVTLVNPVNHYVSDVVRKIEDFSGLEARATEIECEQGFDIQSALSSSLFDSLGISRSGYVDRLLKKYYNE